MKQMHHTKLPRPDGMMSLFFQRYWDIVGQYIIEATLQALNSGMFLAQLNHTHVALTPKKASLEFVSDYCPVSLCNVLYKIVTKILANRLKVILPDIISKT